METFGKQFNQTQQCYNHTLLCKTALQTNKISPTKKACFACFACVLARLLPCLLACLPACLHACLLTCLLCSLDCLHFLYAVYTFFISVSNVKSPKDINHGFDKNRSISNGFHEGEMVLPETGFLVLGPAQVFLDVSTTCCFTFPGNVFC